MNKISERAALEFMPATGLEADIDRGYGNLGLIPHPRLREYRLLDHMIRDCSIIRKPPCARGMETGFRFTNTQSCLVGSSTSFARGFRSAIYP